MAMVMHDLRFMLDSVLSTVGSCDRSRGGGSRKAMAGDLGERWARYSRDTRTPMDRYQKHSKMRAATSVRAEIGWSWSVSSRYRVAPSRASQQICVLSTCTPHNAHE